SVKTALKLSGGAVLISIIDGEEKLYSEKMACINCGINIAPLEPRSFSFNSAFGACRRCQGIGTVMEMDEGKIIPDGNVPAGKVDFLSGVEQAGATFLRSALVAIIEKFTTGDPLEPPDPKAKPRKSKLKKIKDLVFGREESSLLKVKFNDLPDTIRDAFLNGTKRWITFRHGDYKFERELRGALRAMRDRLENPPSEKIRTALEELVAPIPCPVCDGKRLQPESLAVRVNGLG